MAAGVSLSTYLRGPGEQFDTSRKTLRATVAMTEGQHHLATVTTIQGDVDTVLEATTQAAVMTVEANGKNLTFRGYLDTGGVARKSSTGENVLSILGVTSVLRAGEARAWTKARPRDIASEILDPYKLGLEFDAYNDFLEFFSQSNGESDWQTLSRLADRIGFSLVSDGPLVRFVDVLKEVRRAASVGYETIVIPSFGASTSNTQSFRLLTTATPSGADYRNWKMSGTDALRQRFSYEVSFARGAADIEPEFDGVHSGTFTSMGQAMIEARRVRQQARWTQVAKVAGYGYRDFRPGRCVQVVDRNGAYGGFWYVTDVLHSFDNTKNLSATEAKLCRTTQMAVRQDIIVDPYRAPDLRLVGGRWQCDRFWRKVS